MSECVSDMYGIMGIGDYPSDKPHFCYLMVLDIQILVHMFIRFHLTIKGVEHMLTFDLITGQPTCLWQKFLSSSFILVCWIFKCVVHYERSHKHAYIYVWNPFVLGETNMRNNHNTSNKVGWRCRSIWWIGWRWWWEVEDSRKLWIRDCM